METWKSVRNFEDYEVSTLGRVRKGAVIMKHYDNGLGYLAIRLRRKTDRKRVRFYIHRIVIETFRPNDTRKKMEVNHINHDKSNNNIENLEWVTHKENLVKAVIALGKQAFRPRP